MKQLDVPAIASSGIARFDFLADFVGFTDEDWETLRASVRFIAPLLPAILDRLYDHLLDYDDTRRVFLGSRGEIDPAYMALRKEHLTEWFLETAGAAAQRERFATYLTHIGRIHTSQEGDDSRSVPPRYIVALMGCIQASLTEAIAKAFPQGHAESYRLIIAWNKMLVIQLEFFLRALAPHWPAWDESTGHA